MDFRIKHKLRVLPPPGEGWGQSLAQHAPRAEALLENGLQKVRPALFSAYQIRRRLATGFVALLAVWLFAHVMFGANGMVVYRQKKAEYQELQKQVGELDKENDGYTAHINSLKTDPKTIEQEAREQLHYARPGEVIYVAPAPTTQERPVLNSARK